MNIINIIKNNLPSKKLKYFILNILSVKNLPPTTYHLKPNLGFTLIETLVAISILMIAVTSPLTIAQKGLSSAFYAKDQIIASYLAQDAIEYLRNLSDQNVANECNWLSGGGGACVSGINIKTPCGTACTVDTTTGTGITVCPVTTGCTALYYNDNLYQQGSSGVSTTFTRSVVVKEIQDDKEALITVTMSWKDKSKSRNLVVNTRIFNWR